MLLGSLLVDWSVRGGCVATADLLSLPDEILKELALVLGEKKDLGLLDDIRKISDENLALTGEVLGGALERL